MYLGRTWCRGAHHCCILWADSGRLSNEPPWCIEVERILWNTSSRTESKTSDAGRPKVFFDNTRELTRSSSMQPSPLIVVMQHFFISHVNTKFALQRFPALTRHCVTPLLIVFNGSTRNMNKPSRLPCVETGALASRLDLAWRWGTES